MADTRSTLIPSKAPNLPMAPGGYSPQFMEQLNNALRLYFAQIDNINASVLGLNGGRYIECPNGLFFNTTSQTIAAINTAYPIEYNAVYLADGVRLVDAYKVYIDVGGIYNFQYTGQLQSTNSSAKNIDIWLARDGVDIGYSTRMFTLSGSGQYLSISFNFNIDVLPGSYIQLNWASDSTNVDLHASTAVAPHPGTSSSILAINYVSALPVILPTPP